MCNHLSQHPVCIICVYVQHVYVVRWCGFFYSSSLKSKPKQNWPKIQNTPDRCADFSEHQAYVCLFVKAHEFNTKYFKHSCGGEGGSLSY